LPISQNDFLFLSMVKAIKHDEALSQEQVDKILSAQRAFFKSGQTLPYRFRREQLKKLRKSIVENEQAICEALYQDFRKSHFEGYATEIAVVLAELDNFLKNLESWMKPKSVSASLLNFPSSDSIHKDPYGVSLIIGPWNYPFQLAINPLIGAIGGGNCAVIKPSELTPHTSALVEQMVAECFDPAYVTVVQGGIPESQLLLAQHWDHIFFTGSVRVGKIVAMAAARNLTPNILELGGKSPCIVDETADIKLAARRIIWGKFINGGQTCIAPDYLLAQSSIKDQLLTEMKKVVTDFYGEDPQQSPDFPRIINEKNFERVTSFLEDGVVICGGNFDVADHYIAPTILDQVTWDDNVMLEEIFGPVLPVLTFETLDEAIEQVTAHPKPLSLYLFSRRSRRQEKILKETTAGGMCINDVVTHYVNPNLPFGGVGNSGHGTYHGKYSFLAFTHQKSVSKKGNWLDVPLRYPPYKGKLEWVKRAFKVGG
jgi:aldehyde dehydrogenase (NAD+)